MIRFSESRERGSSFWAILILGMLIGGGLVLAGGYMYAQYFAPSEGGAGTAMIRPFRGEVKVVTPESGDALTFAVKKVAPAVVNIDTKFKVSADKKSRLERLPDLFRDWLDDKEFGPPVPRQGQGSGVIINARRGYILTNAHVVENAKQILVTLPDQREFSGKLVGVDTLSDIAVVQISGKNLPEAKLGTSKDLEIGSWAIAIGNPFGYNSTVTVGVVSALGRVLGTRDKTLENLIQTDAAINPGNSGGPLCNIKGEVIGINTAIFSTTGSTVGIGFAIPVDRAKRVADKLIRGEKVAHPYIGVTVSNITEVAREYLKLKDTRGALIAEVVPNGPADRAGIEEGDVIREIDHKQIHDSDDVVEIVRSHKIGDVITVVVLRNGSRRFIKVKIGEMSETLNGDGDRHKKER